jgi:hypothetical protein
VKRESDSQSPTRKPGEPLRNAKAEAYARLRAQGRPAREAADELGLAEGKAYMKFECSQEHRARVAELKAAEDAPAKLSLDMLASELYTNVVAARHADQFKASTEALVRLADLYRENREHFDSQRTQDSSSSTPATEARGTDRRARLTAVPSVKETA